MVPYLRSVSWFHISGLCHGSISQICVKVSYLRLRSFVMVPYVMVLVAAQTQPVIIQGHVQS